MDEETRIKRLRRAYPRVPITDKIQWMDPTRRATRLTGMARWRHWEANIEGTLQKRTERRLMNGFKEHLMEEPKPEAEYWAQAAAKVPIRGIYATGLRLHELAAERLSRFNMILAPGWRNNAPILRFYPHNVYIIINAT